VASSGSLRAAAPRSASAYGRASAGRGCRVTDEGAPGLPLAPLATSRNTLVRPMPEAGALVPRCSGRPSIPVHSRKSWNGFCAYLFARKSPLFVIKAPIFVRVWRMILRRGPRITSSIGATSHPWSYHHVYYFSPSAFHIGEKEIKQVASIVVECDELSDLTNLKEIPL
jgi:hypothetical protein